MDAHRDVEASRGTRCARWTWLLCAWLLLACKDDPSTEDACERGYRSLQAYAAQNASCATAADCVIVGSCGPSYVMIAVAQSAAAETQRRVGDLQSLSCAYDGYLFEAACVAGRCSEVMTGRYCGMPQLDAGTRALTLEGMDAATEAR